MDQHLVEALDAIDRPGDVAAAGDRELTMPGLEVEGLGAVGLPLSRAQARALIRRCRQAPYGKGTQTLVDTDVRRVWEMDPAQFELTNPKWKALIRSIVEEVKQRLGLDECKLSAHLYKLLLYEKGSFFLPHRDGERLDAMVATLIVTLPCAHEGGELVVRHEGREHEIAFPGAASGLGLSWAAFYADCSHEVRPLRSGYRPCLVYNVTLARSRRRKERIDAPSYGAVTARIAELLGAWPETDERQKRAVTLEHAYTQDGLELDRLKGADRARAEVLFEAAEQAGCVAHLALLTLWQLGDVDHDYADYSYRRRRRYGSRYRSRYGYDQDDDPGRRYRMGEILESTLTASHWSDRHGEAHQLGEIRVDKAEVVAGGPLDDGEPSEEEFEDYTGNAGMTLERWYHRAAVVIWPRGRHFAVLCGVGTQAAIGGLAGDGEGAAQRNEAAAGGDAQRLPGVRRGHYRRLEADGPRLVSRRGAQSRPGRVLEAALPPGRSRTDAPLPVRDRAARRQRRAPRRFREARPASRPERLRGGARAGARRPLAGDAASQCAIAARALPPSRPRQARCRGVRPAVRAYRRGAGALRRRASEEHTGCSGSSTAPRCSSRW